MIKHSKIENQQSKIDNGKSAAGNRRSTIEYRQSKIRLFLSCHRASVRSCLVLALASTTFAQSGGGYVIRKSTFDGGGHSNLTDAGGTYRLSGTIGQHDAGDPQAGDYVLTGGFWSPVAISPASDDPLADPSGFDKNRFLSFTMPASGSKVAIRIRLVDLQNPNPANPPCCPAPDYSSFEGEDRWVGPPAQYPESAENPGGPQFIAAILQCAPHYRSDWDSFGLIHVTGGEILPSGEYLVHTVAEAGGALSPNGLTALTPRWGDVVAPFNPPDPSTQPDFVDISSLVDKFKNVSGAPIRARAQLQPRVPSLSDSISFLDISACVDAFEGFAFPAFWGPCPCPSSSTCPTPDGCGRCSP